MTKIKMLNDRIIFDGHADTRQECETITLMCDNLAQSKDFKTIRYESGYAEFEKVGKIDELKFVSEPMNCTINFDSHITKVEVTNEYADTYTWTTSGQTFLINGNSYTTYIFTVTLENGFEINTVQATEAEQYEILSFSNNEITAKTYSSGIGSGFTITTKSASGLKQVIDVSKLPGWVALATGNHQITIKTKASGYADSAISNAVTVNKKPAATLQYYGTATKLSVARRSLAATTVGNYALFGGGYKEFGMSTVVDAYDTSLTRTIPTALSVARESLAATTVGNYALFGGGEGTDDFIATVEAYDTSLTRTIPTALSVARRGLAATTIGNYALFGGGQDNSYNDSEVVDAYDTSLTRTIPMGLEIGRQDLAATTIGNYALFGGGNNAGEESESVDAYNTSLTKTMASSLSRARSTLAATTVGNYALFGGGGLIETVDAYDTSLTRTIPTALSQGRSNLSATTIANYALFGGGDGRTEVAVVDAYDTSLTRTIPTALSVARKWLGATTVGNYALFGGGSPITSVVDVYTVA